MEIRSCHAYYFKQKKTRYKLVTINPTRVGKVFEQVMYKHVYNHLITNTLIYQYQSGFLPGHSTVYHLIELVHNTYLALANMK